MMMMMMMMMIVRSVRMLTQGKSYEVESGDRVELECQFYADSFNLFDYPVVWHKRQRHWPHQQHVIHQQYQQQQHAWLTRAGHKDDPVEDCQVNMMGNLLEPFASVNRYQATFVADPPKYLFGLLVTGRRRFICNLYLCNISSGDTRREVRGPEPTAPTCITCGIRANLASFIQEKGGATDSPYTTRYASAFKGV